jgi:HD superfamily phosphodiesterase
MELYNYLFRFVVLTCKLFNIDESHGLKHSMDVFYFSNKIYQNELLKNPNIEKHKNIIDTSSILHDMCDKKYMDEDKGIKRIYDYMENKISNEELDISIQIMKTMSYSKVKKNGFPTFNEYQLAYNIVREADLLASYDFDRCIIYQMLRNNNDYEKAYEDAINLFDNRVFKYLDEKLFTLDYSRNLAYRLHESAYKRISTLKRIL